MSKGISCSGIDRQLNKQYRKVVFTKTDNDRSWVNAFATLPDLTEPIQYKFRVTFVKSYIASFAFGLATHDFNFDEFQ